MVWRTEGEMWDCREAGGGRGQGCGNGKERRAQILEAFKFFNFSKLNKQKKADYINDLSNQNLWILGIADWILKTYLR